MIFDCNKKKVTFDNINKIYLIPAIKDLKDIKNNIWWSESELLNIRTRLELKLHIIYKLHNIDKAKEALRIINNTLEE